MSFIQSFALFLFALQVPHSTLAAPSANTGLAISAKAAGKKYFGTATDNPELGDSTYVTGLSNTKDFSQITPGNSMKWDATEPSPGKFSFSGGDAIVSLAQKNGQLVRGHTCVWHNQLPAWVTSGGFDKAALQSIVTRHTSTVVGHYKGKIWDVLNEVFNDDGTFRDSVFFKTIGQGYIPLALKAARAADPAAKLYINDFSVESTGAKSNALFNLVKSLKAQGTPIDGVGFQSHLIVGEVPSLKALMANMQRFTALGLEVAITELDIRMPVPATAAHLQQQKQDYQTVITACKKVAGCVGVTIWDYTDKYSWIPSTFPGQGSALPFNEKFARKPAYDGIVAGFNSK